MQREQKTISGRLLEINFFPVFENGRRKPFRSRKEKPSTAAQKRYNDKKAVKNAIRIANANFDETDYLIHPTFYPEKAPQTEQAARLEMGKYIRRIRYARKTKVERLAKQLKAIKKAATAQPENEHIKEIIEKVRIELQKLREPLRYMYTIEQVNYQSGTHKGRANWHFHAFISGGLTREETENLWTCGAINADRYQPDKFGFEAAARYMTKAPKGQQRFTTSKNLIQPKTLPPKDHHTTRSKVEKMAKERVDDREYWERRYKGYRFVGCDPRYNPYNGHWYITVIMYKTSGTPPSFNKELWGETAF